MCGIIGVLGNTNKKELCAFLDPIVHRGNSNFELDVFDSAGIGCNRLQIVDSENGKQPFSNKDKSINVVFNGEIFNYDYLRRLLEEKNYKFKTNCDTELIIYLYEEYKMKFVEKIDSEMFAIIIYDSRLDKLIVTRDRFGVKPLYYAKDSNGRIIFASELKQLVFKENIFKIKEFTPGTIYDGFTFYKYSHYFDNLVSKENLLSLFEKSIKKRLNYKGKIGILYSGGIDSSLVLYFANKHKKNIVAYICGNDNSIDKKFAVEYCKKNNINYKVVEPKKPSSEKIKKLVKIIEGTDFNLIAHSFTNYFVYEQMSKDNIEVALCGEGADELFGGYNEFNNVTEDVFNKGRRLLLDNLHHTQLQRVDRISMHFTIETRVPFLDSTFIDNVLLLENIFHEKTPKNFLRDISKDILPIEIINRKKMPFSTGAGIPIGDLENKDNSFSSFNFKSLVEEEFQILKYFKFKESKRINKDNFKEFFN